MCEFHGAPINYQVFREENGQSFLYYHCTSQQEDGEWCGSWSMTNDETTILVNLCFAIEPPNGLELNTLQ